LGAEKPERIVLKNSSEEKQGAYFRGEMGKLRMGCERELMNEKC